MTCAVLRFRCESEETTNTIRQVEVGPLVGLFCGYPADVIAATYATTTRCITRMATRVLLDVAKQHNVTEDVLDILASYDDVKQGTEMLCFELTRRGGHPVLFWDLLSVRERVEGEAVLALFETFKRITTRLKEIDDELQPDSGA